MENKGLTFKIERGVPIPQPLSQTIAATLENMEVGDSFELGQSPSVATVQMVKLRLASAGK